MAKMKPLEGRNTVSQVNFGLAMGRPDARPSRALAEGRRAPAARAAHYNNAVEWSFGQRGRAHERAQTRGPVRHDATGVIWLLQGRR
jgi:hypothetical protein